MPLAKDTSPLVLSICPNKIFIKVDLPFPLGPIKASLSLSLIEKETFSNNISSPNSFFIC